MPLLPQYGFSFLILLTCLNGSSQVDFRNTTYEVKDTNVIFRGFNNSFKLSNTTDKSLTISSTMCRISKISNNGDYEVYCGKEGSDTVYITKGNRVLRSMVFKIKEFPYGSLFRLGNIKKKSASKNEIIANRGIVFNNSECNCTIVFRIVSYKLKIKSDRILDGEKEIGIEGPLLSSLAISIINRLGRGDVLEFANMVAIPLGGCPREAPSFFLKIE